MLFLGEGEVKLDFDEVSWFARFFSDSYLWELGSDVSDRVFVN